MITGKLCNKAMGMQNGRIKNPMITASSNFDVNHASRLARLHGKRRGSVRGAWSARYNNRYQWLQVDFGRAAKIVRIATQGRQDYDQWVTQYLVMYGLDGLRFVHYKERNNFKVRNCKFLNSELHGAVRKLKIHCECAAMTGLYAE